MYFIDVIKLLVAWDNMDESLRIEIMELFKDCDILQLEAQLSDILKQTADEKGIKDILPLISALK